MSVATTELLERQDKAAFVANLWERFNIQRSGWLDERAELRDYLFATDTTKTANSALPWSNTTTIPKLVQIRDNLHSNYLSSLFPHDDWLSWVAFTKDAAHKDKAKAIQTYMSNKTREGGFRTTVSLLLNDYIDYGNAFVMPSFESRYKEMANGEKIAAFVGPKAVRLSPLDIVFDPKAVDFESSYKVVRSLKSIGELAKLGKSSPDSAFWLEAIKRRQAMRTHLGGTRKEEFEKDQGYSVDGFGSLTEYYNSDYVEILEFYGDHFDMNTMELEENQVITVVDRSMVVRQGPTPSWFEGAPIRTATWRKRPDNLWGMGPLDNLVGMQYRLDHLENLTADALDLAVNPPLVVEGNVEEFNWGPNEEISVDEGGKVYELGKNLSGIHTAEGKMEKIMATMELMAGAPREAMGQRTPGEKTALEVSTLSNAASRIFQEKITSFEIELLEPILNLMLESATRNMVESDIVSVMDDDLGVQQFQEITKEDITANGKLRPIGARHYAKQAQDLQNIIGIANSPLWAKVEPHTSAEKLTKYIDDVAGIKAYGIFSKDVAVMENQDTQRLANVAKEDLETEDAQPTEEEFLGQ